ncbi:hypothetical protein TNCV_4300861 [Trichonephila clavipes]|nr:hypothetical protein TNCV_4300861 [Trichonephila clavipes]
MLGHTWQGFTRLSPHCYCPSLACPIPKFVSNRAYLGSFGTARWASHEFERTRGKVTAKWEPDTVQYIKTLNKERSTLKIFWDQAHWTPRTRGRPNMKWVDRLKWDFLALRVINWKTVAKTREAWKKILEKAKAHSGLSRY